MSWDPFQREVLAELGHVLYHQAGTEMAPLDLHMLARVARAAGMSADDLQSRFEDMQMIAGLQGDAAAKRALWPRLRELRRQYP